MPFKVNVLHNAYAVFVSPQSILFQPNDMEETEQSLKVNVQLIGYVVEDIIQLTVI